MKRSFAKYIALFLAAAVALGAAGCGKDQAELQEENAVVSEENMDTEGENSGEDAASSGENGESGEDAALPVAKKGDL